MESHERKREVWMPSDLLPQPESCPDEFHRSLRDQAKGIPDPIRAALALNMLTEEGLPHFHRLLAVYLGDDSFWRSWNNLWTAEEDRHGQVLHDYARDTRILQQRKLEEMQFEYLRAGFHPEWDRDPYRVFAYTTVQERATQFSHGETGRIVGEYEPRLAEVLSHIAKDEARHYAFYRSVFELILERDPNANFATTASSIPSCASCLPECNVIVCRSRKAPVAASAPVTLAALSGGRVCREPLERTGGRLPGVPSSSTQITASSLLPTAYD